MLWFLLSIILTISAAVTLFLVLASGDLHRFRERFAAITAETSLPIITKEGQILDTKEDLDEQLTVLQDRLESKQGELLTSKSRILTAAESIQKLQATSDQVRRYYLKLKTEIERSEHHCKSLEDEIEEYRRKRQNVLKNGKLSEKSDQFLKNLCKDLGKVKAEPNSDSALKNYTASMESRFYPDYQSMYSTT